MSEAARSRRSNVRFEPKFDVPRGAASGSEDPMAELARLVGQEDPFRNAVRSPGNTKPESPGFAAGRMRFAPQQHEVARDIQDDHGHGEVDPYAEQPGEDDMLAHEDQWSEAEHEGYAAHSAHDGHGAELTHGYDDATAESGYDLQRYAAPPLTPDLWAEEGDPGSQYFDPDQAEAREPAGSSRAPRRPLVVLASVLILTGGGLAATFLARSGLSSAAQSRSTPTIMAAAGPNKIKLDDSAARATPEDADSALLSRNGASSGGPTKVVNSQEQPIDLNQLPKAAPSPEAQTAVDATPTGSSSPFPEPKKVKTFLVRPDGTMIASSRSGASGSAEALAATRPAAQRGAPDSEAAGSAAPRPSTPTTSARTATTPKSPPTSIADLASAAVGDAAGGPARAAQPASPGVSAQAKPKPIEVADASNSDAAPAATGAFALQLAAAPSEQDARNIFARLQKKYSGELGSFKPTIRKAETGEKSVYRVRVGSLSQDQAKALCARLQSSGGPCFVVHN